MRKTSLFQLMTILMVTLLSLGFASCGSDDDDSVDSSGNGTIIGTWEETDYTDGTWQWTFNSNGKGSCKVTNKTTYSFSFDYILNGSSLKISGYEDGERYTDTYTVSFSSDNRTMTWTEKFNGNTYTRILKRK